MHASLLVSVLLLGQAPPPAPVQPKVVRKVVADGQHNAFTALARFKGQYFLAFRAGKDHNSRDGQLVVLHSSDAETWKEAFRLHLGDDDRDPQFLVTERKLILYDPSLKGTELTTYATWTEDGQTWTKPQAVYEKTFIIWKPTTHDGKFYSGAHKIDNTSGGKKREVHFVTSSDGLDWRKISTIRGGSWESETTLLFDARGHATAFLRQKYGSPPCQILEADAPYQEWRGRKPNIQHMSGHSVHTFRGVTYFLSRTMDSSRKRTGTMIYTYAHGDLTPYCELPSGGDCSYAEAVERGDTMLVSYYSSHEGTTNIYLAEVPLR